MPRLELGGATIEIEDSGNLAIIQAFVNGMKDKLTISEEKVTSLQATIDGFKTDEMDMSQSFMVGEESKTYSNMQQLYNDLCAYYKTLFDEMTGQIKALESELSMRTDSADLLKMVAERRKLERICIPALGLDYNFDSTDDSTLKKAVIKKQYGVEMKDLDTMPEGEINGMFLVATKYSTAQQSFDSADNGNGGNTPTTGNGVVTHTTLAGGY